jgi:UDP-N-acetylmuramate--alanine ligase
MTGMHIFFSGIGGAAIGPLALIAKQAGYKVSGSDKQESNYLDYLRKHGINDIIVGQSREAIAELHDRDPIDWFVHTAFLDAGKVEYDFCKEQDIKVSKRDELLNLILSDKQLKLIAIAGTHGKTTTTAMAIWLMKQLNLPISYSVGAKISFGEMGVYEPSSEYFVYEADEFDRNFLNFEPHLSIISGVSWDHHEIFPTRDEYQQAFRDFINQSEVTVAWQDDATYLSLDDGVQSELLIQDDDDERVHDLTLKGLYNRRDAWLVVQAIHKLTGEPIDTLITHMNDFPGSNRRMEMLAPGLYSDYAHTPEKIRGAMSVALEMAADDNKPLIVIYEPLTNRRQHFMINDYRDCFTGAAQVYWAPSYLAREDPEQRIIEPAELIARLDDPTIAQPVELDDALERTIEAHLAKGDMVVAMAGGGGGSLDEWLRQKFSA